MSAMNYRVKYDPTTGLQYASGLPKVGELFEFAVTKVGEGHAKDWNNCSCRHRWGPAPGQPEPVGKHYVGEKFIEEVAKVIHWADNSIEIVSVTGKRHTAVASHGDAC